MILSKRVFPRFEQGNTLQALSLLGATEQALKNVKCIVEYEWDIDMYICVCIDS